MQKKTGTQSFHAFFSFLPDRLTHHHKRQGDGKRNIFIGMALALLGRFAQPRSQGSLLPALRWAGRREPWERGCVFPTEMTDFRTLSYTSTSKISTLSYALSLKCAPFRVPPPPDSSLIGEVYFRVRWTYDKRKLTHA